METFLSVAQVLVAIAMTAIILVQRGAGAAAGSGFGAGASGTVFGARGSASFLSRSTAFLAAAFFVISLIMAVMASQSGRTVAEEDLGVMSGVIDTASETVEVNDVPSAPAMQAVDTDGASDVPDLVPAMEGDTSADLEESAGVAGQEEDPDQ